MENLLFIVLAALGLGFLVFIHELGHYIMARRVGMKVEVFSIGFGKPFLTWKHKGVEWRMCWLLFGGYVKIAGMEKEKNNQEPSDIPEGFFGKKPFDRIKVAFMGPFVNIVFAFLLFGVIWIGGGREKPFAEFTQRLGWVDPHSELYAEGVRPGDVITGYDDQSFKGTKDLFYAAMLSDKEVTLHGYKLDYATREKLPFNYKVSSYQYPGAQEGILTLGPLSTARYLMYDQMPGTDVTPMLEGSPMENSGLEKGDRVLWADGVLVYSMDQLSYVINESRVMLTVQRGEETLLVRVPRIKAGDLKLDNEVSGELSDWSYGTGAKDKINSMYFIPFNINTQCIIENDLGFIDAEGYKEAFPAHRLSPLEVPLLKGDRILAVDGMAVHSGPEVLRELQTRHVSMVVERNPLLKKVNSWDKADDLFDQNINWQDLQTLTASLGTSNAAASQGSLVLLKPVVPMMLSDFPLSIEKKAKIAAEVHEQKKAIAEIADPDKRARAFQLLEDNQKKLVLGFRYFMDRKVDYNPTPVVLFTDICKETSRTFVALFSGYLSPKWIGVGPIGIVEVIHHGWMLGAKEALFWMAVISLNLGILNLLPIPVLDGGYICLAILEMFTKRPMKAKTMERLIFPFVILLIGFLVFATYQDVTRLFHQFLG